MRASRFLQPPATCPWTRTVSRAAAGRRVPARTRATLEAMRTLVLDPPTAGLDELIERRRRSGLDRMDEVWEGVLHMVPAPSGPHSSLEWQIACLLRPLAEQAGLHAGGQFNLGEGEHDFRVPDGGLHRVPPLGVWHPTAALVLEIVSPGDESWEKLPFYAAHHVGEVLIVDPATRAVAWLGLEDQTGEGKAGESRYRPIRRSALIELGPSELAGQIDWPAGA
jgi:Uma2 family endonuclease